MNSAVKGLAYYRWPFAIVGLFFFTLLGGAITLWLALSSRSELIHPSPYERGLAFQEVIDARNVAASEGWKLQSSFDSDSAELVVRLSGRDGAPIVNARLFVRAAFPASSAHDWEAALTEDPENPGRYVRKMTEIRAGLWLMEYEIEVAGRKGLMSEKSHF